MATSELTCASQDFELALAAVFKADGPTMQLSESEAKWLERTENVAARSYLRANGALPMNEELTPETAPSKRIIVTKSSGLQHLLDFIRAGNGEGSPSGWFTQNISKQRLQVVLAKLVAPLARVPSHVVKKSPVKKSSKRRCGAEDSLLAGPRPEMHVVAVEVLEESPLWRILADESKSEEFWANEFPKFVDGLRQERQANGSPTTTPQKRKPVQSPASRRLSPKLDESSETDDRLHAHEDNTCVFTSAAQSVVKMSTELQGRFLLQQLPMSAVRLRMHHIFHIDGSMSSALAAAEKLKEQWPDVSFAAAFGSLVIVSEHPVQPDGNDDIMAFFEEAATSLHAGVVAALDATSLLMTNVWTAFACCGDRASDTTSQVYAHVDMYYSGMTFRDPVALTQSAILRLAVAARREIGDGDVELMLQQSSRQLAETVGLMLSLDKHLDPVRHGDGGLFRAVELLQSASVAGEELLPPIGVHLAEIVHAVHETGHWAHFLGISELAKDIFPSVALPAENKHLALAQLALAQGRYQAAEKEARMLVHAGDMASGGSPHFAQSAQMILAFTWLVAAKPTSKDRLYAIAAAIGFASGKARAQLSVLLVLLAWQSHRPSIPGQVLQELRSHMDIQAFVHAINEFVSTSAERGIHCLRSSAHSAHTALVRILSPLPFASLPQHVVEASTMVLLRATTDPQRLAALRSLAADHFGSLEASANKRAVSVLLAALDGSS